MSKEKPNVKPDPMLAEAFQKKQELDDQAKSLKAELIELIQARTKFLRSLLGHSDIDDDIETCPKPVIATTRQHVDKIENLVSILEDLNARIQVETNTLTTRIESAKVTLQNLK
tara:strand:- start:1006 stop:1347 length:342 start_codon:yes stop_codon:yes gene_type:complete